MPGQNFRPREILYLTDFSLSAERAWEHAVALAREFKACLHIMHALDFNRYGLYEPESTALVRTEMLESDREALHRLASRPELEGVAHRVWIEEMTPEEAANKLESDFEIGLVVMGTAAPTGLDRVLQGSTAEAIFRHSMVPVWVVGPNNRIGVGQRLAVRQVLYATDMLHGFGPGAVAASLADQHAALLTVMHVETRFGQDAIRPGERDVLRRVIPPGPRPGTDFAVGFGADPAVAILSEAQRRQADLIVLGARVKPWWAPLSSGTANTVIRSASCPVLICPVRAEEAQKAVVA